MQFAVCAQCLDAYAIGCGVLATIEQWYPARKFNGTMVPHKRNSKVWPGLVTKEKTMKYPTSAMCRVYCVHVQCTTDNNKGCPSLRLCNDWISTTEGLLHNLRVHSTK